MYNSCHIKLERIELLGLDLASCMREAIAESEAAGIAGELPIGAVLVIDGVIVSRGRARHREARSQLMHAEVQCLLNGGEALWRDYERAVLFTSMEPCPMCLGATVMADVPHIVFACHDVVAGCRLAIESVPYIQRHIATYIGGVLEREAREVVAQYDPRQLQYITTDT